MPRTLRAALMALLLVLLLAVPAGAGTQMPAPSLGVVQAPVQAKVLKHAVRDRPASFEQSTGHVDLWQRSWPSTSTLKLCARVTFVNPIKQTVTAENFSEYVAVLFYRVDVRYNSDGTLRIKLKEPASCDGGHPPGELGDGDRNS
jgi:hypothetical protein